LRGSTERARGIFQQKNIRALQEELFIFLSLNYLL